MTSVSLKNAVHPDENRPGRTFLEVVESGNFSAAGDRLNVTQLTVSMRVQALEEVLGRKLFVRQSPGQADGRRPTVPPLRGVAGQYVGAGRPGDCPASGTEMAPSIGAENPLWDSLLIGGLGKFRGKHKDVVVRAEVVTDVAHTPADGRPLDVAITYTRNARSGAAGSPGMRKSLC